MSPEYVPDRLYARLFQPWKLPEAEWPLCRDDWRRVNAITSLPWRGTILDFGSGDGTLGAMVCSHNPKVKCVRGVEQDLKQIQRARMLWNGWRVDYDTALNPKMNSYDGVLCCEVLEHLTPEAGDKVLGDLKRAMKKDAMICVTVPHPTGPRAEYPGHVRKFFPRGLIALLTEFGFTHLNIGNIGVIWIMVTGRA